MKNFYLCHTAVINFPVTDNPGVLQPIDYSWHFFIVNQVVRFTCEHHLLDDGSFDGELILSRSGDELKDLEEDMLSIIVENFADAACSKYARELALFAHRVYVRLGLNTDKVADAIHVMLTDSDIDITEREVYRKLALLMAEELV